MRLLLKLVLGLFALYFCLVWANALPHPKWLPNEMEPLTAVIGAVLFLFSLFEDSLTRWVNPKKVKVSVIESKLYWVTYLLADEPSLRNFGLSLWIENNEDRDTAIVRVKVYPIGNIKHSNEVLEYQDEELSETISAGTSKNIKISFPPSRNQFNPGDKFRLEVDFVGNKKASVIFSLGE